MLLKVGTSVNGYQDGDILCAFSPRRISYEHCHQQCWERGNDRRLAALNNKGLVPVNDVLYDYHNLLCEYRFERLSTTEASITRISDEEVIRFESNKTFIGFNGKAQQMDIASFVDRRFKTLVRDGGNGLPLFDGISGEMWFGGQKDIMSMSRIGKVWKRIENKKQVSKSQDRFKHYPLGRQDVRSHLPLKVANFNDEAANSLVQSEVDNSDPENPVVLKKRKHHVLWRDRLADLGVSEADVLNRNTKVDRRKVMTRRNHSLFLKQR